MIFILVINRTVILDTLNSDNYIDKFQYLTLKTVNTDFNKSTYFKNST